MVSSSAVVTPDRSVAALVHPTDPQRLHLIYCNSGKKFAGIDSKFLFTVYFNDKAIRQAQIS
jgi:hypothetical protein